MVVDLDGKPISEGGLQPSSETQLHLEIYRTRDDVQAVVHTHSVHASAASVVGRDIPPLIDEMLLTIGGPVKVGKYAFPGTQLLAQEACAALGDRNAALLRNHAWSASVPTSGSLGSGRSGGTIGSDLRVGSELRTARHNEPA